MSNNLSFNDGVKEYTINGDANRVIRINTSDYDLIDRFKSAEDNIREYMSAVSKWDENEMMDKLPEIKRFIYEEIDKIFGNGVANTVFYGANPVSTVDGKMIYQNFFDVIIPVIERDFDAEIKKAEKNIEKYNKSAENFKKKTGGKK